MDLEEFKASVATNNDQLTAGTITVEQHFNVEQQLKAAFFGVDFFTWSDYISFPSWPCKDK